MVLGRARRLTTTAGRFRPSVRPHVRRRTSQHPAGVTVGELSVTVGELNVTVGGGGVTVGELSVTVGELNVTVGGGGVTVGELTVTVGGRGVTVGVGAASRSPDRPSTFRQDGRSGLPARLERRCPGTRGAARRRRATNRPEEVRGSWPTSSTS
jgi:hypothetical protein